MSVHRYTFGAIFAVLLGVGAYVACDPEDGTDPERSSELELVVRPHFELPLRDNPSYRPTTILIGVKAIEVHHVEEGWVAMGARTTIDLLAPEEAIPEILSTRYLPEGLYDQLRFHVSFATVEVDRKWYPLEIPSEDQSGLKVHTSFCLEDGVTSSLELDWNVDESLHHNEQRGYWLEPSIDVPSPPTCADDKTARTQRG